MSEDVEALVRAARIVEAATLAREHGDWKTASRLFERACDWASSAEAALAAGEPERALSVAALGGAEDTARRALDQLVASGRGDLARVGDTLRQQGQHAWAARVYEQAGATDRAAEAWERAGERVEAARILEGAGLDGAVRAARVLEAGLRQEDGRGDLLLALGSLLLRSGKPTAALRTLQRVPDDAREKTEALRLSLRALLELGMRDGAAEVQAILAARGEAEEIAERPAPKAQGGAVRPRLYGRYEIVREVSSTATARLLECVDVLRGSRVALKIFSAAADATKGSGRDALAHFVREARVLGQLAHPNIVPLHEVLEQGPALVLEWMPGGTLEERMATDALTPRRAADIAAAILSALGEAHRVGVVHRDLKPANILFDAGGTARLSDFGVAHLGDLSVTATAGSFGSLAYMSPEQRAGRPATVRSDIFGLGTILREMLTGTRSRPLGTEPVPPLSAVHHHLDERHDALLRSFLAEVPDARPANAFEARRALLAIPWPDDHDPLRARPTPSAPRSVHPAAARLDEPLELGAFAVDRWLERPVARLPLTSRRLQQAAIYARNASRLLQPILRVDREGEALWLGAPRGVPLSRPLSPDELTAVGGVLTALHREGFVHGAIDRTTVVLGPDGIELLFPPGDAEADLTAQDDLAALALLG